MAYNQSNNGYNPNSFSIFPELLPPSPPRLLLAPPPRSLSPPPPPLLPPSPLRLGPPSSSNFLPPPHTGHDFQPAVGITNQRTAWPAVDRRHRRAQQCREPFHPYDGIEIPGPVEQREPPEEAQLPNEARLNCPICMSAFTQPTTTRCGHIFCRACILGALAAEKKCPICRRRLTRRNTMIRVYLP